MILQKKKTGVQPTRGNLYIISRTKKNGSIVNETAAKVIVCISNSFSFDIFVLIFLCTNFLTWKPHLE